jgi:hypothetical protein
MVYHARTKLSEGVKSAYMVYGIWSTKDCTVWRLVVCVPVYMVSSKLCFVENYSIDCVPVCMVPRSKLCGEVKTVCLSVRYSKDCTV